MKKMLTLYKLLNTYHFNKNDSLQIPFFFKYKNALKHTEYKMFMLRE